MNHTGRAIECKVVPTKFLVDDFPQLVGRKIVAYTVIDESRVEKTYNDEGESSGASQTRVHRIVLDNDTYIEL